MTAEEYFQRGNECRQRGDWQEALANYMEAIELDPNSPAVIAKEMVENILNYEQDERCHCSKHRSMQRMPVVYRCMSERCYCIGSEKGKCPRLSVYRVCTTR